MKHVGAGTEKSGDGSSMRSEIRRGIENNYQVSAFGN